MSHILSEGSASNDGFIVVDVNPAFVISIESTDAPFTKMTDKKPAERHWSSKSARSRIVRQRFAEQPYYVPTHSVIRRHSTESWSAADSSSFGDVVKTAERLISSAGESVSSVQREHPSRVTAAVSVGALLNCDNNTQTDSKLNFNKGCIMSRSRSRSLCDLTQHSSHTTHDDTVSSRVTALQNDVLIDRVERKLRNFHVT